jgi:GH25 family lysozyme M1 (1,4-beta-N-acetylmuramidase)
MGSTVQAHERTGARALASPAVAAGGAQGLDVSHYQGAVDWTSVASNGATFAYMKATEGTTYTDPQFATNYAGSANAGLIRGAYHFALPDSSSGSAQAAFFLANGGGWVGDGHTMPPVLDIEYNPYGTADWTGWCYELTPAQMNAWISDFATTIHNRTNRWPVIYTTSDWWSNCTGNDTGTAANSPLWIASPGTDAGTVPGGWSAYTLWQYATSGTFPGDQDSFNGSADQVRTFAQGDGPDQIVAHYTALGGASSSLGNPSGAEYPIAGGWAQNYTNGSIYYSPNTGAWAVQGPILEHYQQLGGPAVIGFPTSDQTATADGTGRSSTFGGTSIYWSPSTGAHAVQGQIRTKWAALGSENGLGYPITDETSTPDGVGRYNHFSAASGASIYWTPNTGAHSIQGQIRTKWAALGWENGLGYPTTDESTTPDGVGRYNHFSMADGASIYWTPSTGAHSIQGQIRSKWSALGWEAGLGYPTTDETGTPDGIGRYNHFTNSASIYWTPATGPSAIYGAIRDKWSSLGWEKSALGYPAGDEYGVTGGRRHNFQHGTITWYSANGSLQVAYS